MQALAEKAPVILAGADELDIIKTFECGQCFRWNPDGEGRYTGVAFGRAATLETRGGVVYIDAQESDSALWRDYFDLGLDYESVRRSFFGAGEYLRRCCDFGRGIRILRQEPWEALCSFIISQNNNITRIKGVVERLCECFGEPFEYGGARYYAFPTAERLAGLEPEALSPLRCGYRAEYIISAARGVSDGRPDLSALCGADFDSAIAELEKLKGVGPKVANCAALFGLHAMNGFPIDTWMCRALSEHFPKGFDPASLGPYAGLAQQYIFYYARSQGRQKPGGRP